MNINLIINNLEIDLKRLKKKLRAQARNKYPSILKEKIQDLKESMYKRNRLTVGKISKRELRLFKMPINLKIIITN